MLDVYLYVKDATGPRYSPARAGNDLGICGSSDIRWGSWGEAAGCEEHA